MMDWILSQPFWLAAAFLTCVAAFRSQATYWLGRGIRAGVVKTQWARRFETEKSQRVINALQKWGWPLIPVSFLTIGFQTSVQLTAGLIGWRWPRYTLAAAIGWILWGCAYAAGGLAIFLGLVALAARSWWLVLLAVLVVAAVIVAVVLTRRRHKAAAEEEACPSTPVGV